MATATIYAGAGDGYIRKYGGAWSGIAATGSVTGNDAGPTSTGDYLCMSENTNPMAYRGFLPFDLSSLPAGANVLSVDLHVYVTASGTAGGGTTANNSVCVVKGTPASNTTLATTDYGNVGSTLFADRKSFASFSTSADNTISLNASGVAEAQSKADADGYLVLALRAGYDFDNTAPSGNSNIQTRYSEYASTTYDPYIVVTYSTGRTTSDTWAWSDTAVPSAARAASDTWAWSDAAVGAMVRTRTTSDAWAWSDRASRTGANSVNVTPSAGDGYTQHYHASDSWSTIRSTGSALNAYPAATTDWCVYNDGGIFLGDPTKYIYRGHFPLALTAVPAGATIASGDLYLYVTEKLSTHDGYVCLVGSTQASAATLATSDYSLVGTTELSARVRIADLTVGAYNVFPLNAAGIAAMSGGATLKLAIRGSADLDNSAPALSTASGFKVNYQDAASNKPYLTVTYDNTRTTGDTWAWSDSVADAPVAKAGGGTLYNRLASDSWAWSDTAAPSYLVNLESEIELFPAGPLRTTLNGSVNFASLSTITLASMPSGVPTSGQITILSAAGQRAWTVTYTGKSGNNLTGCTSWKSSGTAASGTTVSWHDAEQNFPSIVNLPATTAYPYGRLFASCTRHCGDDVEGTSDGEMVARYSDDGGQTWSTATVIASAVNSAYGIWGTCTAAFADGTLWIGWYEHNVDYFVVKSYSKYSTDGGVTWSSPVEIPATVVEADSTFIATGASPIVDELDDLYLPVYVYPDGADQSDLPYIGYSAIIKSTDYGATWSLRGTIPITTTDDRGTTEPAIADLGDGTWIIMLRQEVGSTPGDTLDRYRIYTDDKGATFRDGASVISNLSNWCNVIRTPDGVLVSQGGREVSPLGPASFYSYDNGATWPSYVMESTYDDKIYYAGADQESVTLQDGTVRVAFIRSCQGTFSVPLSTASTYFRWFQLPPYTMDEWAWSDSATRTFTQPRATSDSWAWSDTASDVLSSYLSRTTSDTWAWSDTAARTSDPIARTTSDTWAWSDTAADTYAGPHYYSRTTSDTWVWSDGTGALGTALYWLRAAARRRSMSAPTKTYTVVQAKGTTRTATWTSPTYESKTEAGILVALDVTAASGTGGLTLRINAHDLAGSTVVPLNTAPTAVTAIGTTSYALYPFGAISGAVTQSTSGYLPRQFSITVTAGDSSSYTYSVGYCLLP